jgi:hypothetical protein
METTRLWAQVLEAPLNEPVVTLGQGGPVLGNVTRTASWSQNFSVNIQAPAEAPGDITFAGGVEEFYLNVEAEWPIDTATMTLTGAITGSFGCPGSMQSMSVALTPTTNASGGMSVQTVTMTGAGVAACPDGSAPTANFTATAALSPG